MSQQYRYGDIANGHVLTPHGWLPLGPPPPPPPPPRPVRAPMSTRAVLGWVGAGFALLIGFIWMGVAVSDATAARERAECDTWNAEWAEAAQADDPSKERFFPIFDRQPDGCQVTDETFIYNLWLTWWALDN